MCKRHKMGTTSVNSEIINSKQRAHGERLRNRVILIRQVPMPGTLMMLFSRTVNDGILEVKNIPVSKHPTDNIQYYRLGRKINKVKII